MYYVSILYISMDINSIIDSIDNLSTVTNDNITNYSNYNEKSTDINFYKTWDNSFYSLVHIKIENLYRKDFTHNNINEDISHNKCYEYYIKEFQNQDDLMMAWEEYRIYKYARRQVKGHYNYQPSLYSFIHVYYKNIAKHYCNIGNIKKFNKFFSLSISEKNIILKKNQYFKDIIFIDPFFYTFINNQLNQYKKSLQPFKIKKKYIKTQNNNNLSLKEN